MSEPIHIISLGAGVQSSTMALMAAAGEITPMPSCAIFADTQAEPKAVYGWLDWLEGQLPFPVYRVTQGDLTAAALTILTNKKTGKDYYSNRIPAFVKTAKATEGQVGRHCTRDFKIYPIQRKVRGLVPASDMKVWRTKHRVALKLISLHEAEKRAARKEHRAVRTCHPTAAWKATQGDALVVQFIGISRDEIGRSKPSRVPWVRHEWPLIESDMRRHDCLSWMKARGFPEPPRSACIYCPYKSNAEWRRLREESPEEFQEAAQFERDLLATHTGIVTPGKIKGIPFLHRSLVPLESVDLSTEAERGQGDLFENECEGMCGV